MKTTLCCLTVGILASLGAASASTFSVVSTADSGPGSLRQAILDANATPGSDTISFQIPGSGVHTIAPLTELPHVTEGVTIDGFSQLGSSLNTLDVGNDAVLLIEISGVNLTSVPLLTVDASGSKIRGLVINRVLGGDSIQINGDGNAVSGNFIGTDSSGSLFQGGAVTAVRVTGSSNTIGGTSPSARNVIAGGGPGNFGSLSMAAGAGNAIQGNYIGVNAAGTAALQPASPTSALDLVFSSNNQIGGTTVTARNVILGTQIGINLSGGANDNVFQGNLIGTNATGTAGLGGGAGIAVINSPTGTVIGGSAPGAGNLISGNAVGIQASDGPSAMIIQGNRIGTDATGTLPIPNVANGIEMLANAGSLIGGLNPGEGNTIAFNGYTGIWIVDNVANHGLAIRGNSIHSNTVLGIDLTGDFMVQPNDAGDADSGCNGLQNFPILTSVAFGASTTTIDGVLRSAPSTTFDVDFFASPPCVLRPHDFLQGETFLGTRPVTTDGSGDAPFSFVLPVAVTPGSPISATATDPAGNTSEFSQRLVLSSLPLSGSASGGAALTISGMLFADPAAVTIGGVPATGVVVTGPGSISAVAPALPPGTVNDVTVTVAGLSGTLPSGYVAGFLDDPVGIVPQFIARLVSNSISSGCGGGNYCPADPVTRAQMAVFLLRSFHGACYVPPPETGSVFADVPAGSFAAAWIEALAAAQVTAGCGAGNYCPSSAVTRGQMAVFLLRTSGGPTYVPPACVTPTFGDVPCSSPFARWIEELVRRAIVIGCGGGNYCPSTAVTRGQMAVLLTATFHLP